MRPCVNRCGFGGIAAVTQDFLPHSTASGRERFFGAHPLLVAMLFQIALWSVVPAILFGNLHTDTLEAAYWGREWALAYSKHPPVTSWMMDLALRTGLPSIFALMLLAQACVAVAALFIWKTVRLFASRETAAFAVLLFVASPASTIYAVQINHNLTLAPFWAATIYFGLLYLEERRWGDAIILGVVAGVGMLTKYEILFALATLLIIGALVPRFRVAFHHPASYVSGLIFILILLPHLWWLRSHGWSSVSRALGAQKISDMALLNTSAVNLIVACFTLFVVPAALLFATSRRRDADGLTLAPHHRLIGACLCLAPLAILIAGALVTFQVIKPLWVLPLSATVAMGLAILFPAGEYGRGQSVEASARLCMIACSVILAGLAAYLVVACVIGKPLTAYSIDTRRLARDTLAYWRRYSAEPLRCIVIAERKIGPSGILWLLDYPLIVEGGFGKLPESCGASGALAVYPPEGRDGLENFPRLCAARQTVPLRTTPPIGRTSMTVELGLIPPPGVACPAP